jgi:hypothetical protein
MLDKRRHLGHDFCLKIRKERCPQSNRLNDQSLVHFNTFQQDSIFPKVTDLPISALLNTFTWSWSIKKLVVSRSGLESSARAQSSHPRGKMLLE